MVNKNSNLFKFDKFIKIYSYYKHTMVFTNFNTTLHVLNILTGNEIKCSDNGLAIIINMIPGYLEKVYLNNLRKYLSNNENKISTDDLQINWKCKGLKESNIMIYSPLDLESILFLNKNLSDINNLELFQDEVVLEIKELCTKYISLNWNSYKERKEVSIAIKIRLHVSFIGIYENNISNLITYILDILSPYKLCSNNALTHMKNKDIKSLCYEAVEYIYNWCKLELQDSIMDRQGVNKNYVKFLIEYYRLINNKNKVNKLWYALKYSNFGIHRTLVNIIDSI